MENEKRILIRAVTTRLIILLAICEPGPPVHDATGVCLHQTAALESEIYRPESEQDKSRKSEVNKSDQHSHARAGARSIENVKHKTWS